MDFKIQKLYKNAFLSLRRSQAFPFNQAIPFNQVLVFQQFLPSRSNAPIGFIHWILSGLFYRRWQTRDIRVYYYDNGGKERKQILSDRSCDDAWKILGCVGEEEEPPRGSRFLVAWGMNIPTIDCIETEQNGKNIYIHVTNLKLSYSPFTMCSFE